MKTFRWRLTAIGAVVAVGAAFASPVVLAVAAGAAIGATAAWGTVSLKQVGYLVNYDFDVVAGKPGIDFNLITKRSFDQTYEIDFIPPA